MSAARSGLFVLAACAALGASVARADPPGGPRVVAQIAPGRPIGARFSGDGERVVTWVGGVASVWSATGARLGAYAMGAAAALDHRGRRLASLDEVTRASVRDLDTGEVTTLAPWLPRGERPFDWVDVWLSADDTRVIGFGEGYAYQRDDDAGRPDPRATLRVWDARTGDAISTFVGRAVDLEAGGSVALVLSDAGRVGLVDLVAATPAFRALPIVDGPVVAFARANATGDVAVATKTSLRVLDAEGAVRWDAPAAPGELCFSRLGARLVERGDGETRVRSAATGRLLARCPHRWGSPAEPRCVGDALAVGDPVACRAPHERREAPEESCMYREAVDDDPGVLTVLARHPQRQVEVRKACGLRGVRLRLRDLATGTSVRLGASVPATDAIGRAGADRLLVAAGSRVYLWDTARLRVVDVFTPDVGQTFSIEGTADGRYAVWAGMTYMEVWDLARGRFLDRWHVGSNDFGVALALSPDGTRAATTHFHSIPRVFGLAEGRFRPLGELDAPAEGMSVAFAADSRRVALGLTRRMVTMTELGQARPRWTHQDARGGDTMDFDFCRQVVVSKAERVHCIGEGALRSFDARTGASVATRAGSFSALDVSDDGVVVTGDGAGRVATWNEADLSPRTDTPTHLGAVVQVLFVRGSHLLASLGAEGEVRLRRERGESAVALLADRTSWLAIADDGTFDSSRGGERLVAAIEGERAYPLGALALRFDRPDVLLARLGAAPALVETYRAGFERRLARLGLSERDLASSFAELPTVTLESVTVGGREAEVVVVASSRGAELRSLAVHVNGAPVVAPEPPRLTGSSARVARRVPLAVGANMIEVAAVDARGAASLPVVRRVEVAGDQAADVVFLGVGVSRYADPSIRPLDYAASDAQRMSDAFAALRLPAGHVRVETLTDARADRRALVDAAERLGSTRPGDTVVVYLAGHGIQRSGAGAVYRFLPHDAEALRVAETSLSMPDFETLLARAPAQRKLLVLDTCASGERTGAAAREASFIERDRLIFTDVARRSGVVVVSAASGDEPSFEGAEWGGGVFTEAFAASLGSARADADSDGRLTAVELLGAVRERVVASTDGRQHPAIDRDNPEVVVSFPAASMGPAGPAAAARPRTSCTCDVPGEFASFGRDALVALASLGLLASGRRARWRARGRA